jgi:V/A-type H+-transporting ATPase subunit K
MIVPKKKNLLLCVGLILLAFGMTGVWAAEPATSAHGEGEAAPQRTRSDLATGMIALGSALAVGLCALATGLAQSRIGAAGCGAIAEKPETSGTVILLVAIPETMVILGFVIGVVLLFTL